jgi:hypothetical protein
MSPTRAARLTGAGILGAVALLLWWASGDTVGTRDRLDQIVMPTLMLGAPLAIAGAIVAGRLARAARGRDAAERILGAATAGLDTSGAEWGTAMRAELASIEDPSERRRFALGSAMVAIRAGFGREAWLVGLAVGIAFALCTLVASRVSLAGTRAGIIGLALLGPPLVLFGVASVTARTARSFRSGVVAGGLALIAGLVGFLAVAMAEAVRWRDVAGVYLLDGDAPKGGLLTTINAVLDPITPFFLVVFLLVWTPWPVLGAAAGASLRRHEVPTAHEPA